MQYNSGTNYYSFFLFRTFAKKYYNDLFFEHDSCYTAHVWWRIDHKIRGDFILLLSLVFRSLSLWIEQVFPVWKLALALLWSFIVYLSVTLFGWIGWFGIKKWFNL